MATKKKGLPTNSSGQTTGSKTTGGSAPAVSKAGQEDSDVGIKIQDARQFLKEVYIEFHKITWPDRAQVIRETYSVLVLVALITLLVLGFDWFLGKVVFGPLDYFARMHGGGIGHP
jgi:preprotein translocase SecE subunit